MTVSADTAPTNTIEAIIRNNTRALLNTGHPNVLGVRIYRPRQEDLDRARMAAVFGTKGNPTGGLADQPFDHPFWDTVSEEYKPWLIANGVEPNPHRNLEIFLRELIPDDRLREIHGIRHEQWQPCVGLLIGA